MNSLAKKQPGAVGPLRAGDDAYDAKASAELATRSARLRKHHGDSAIAHWKAGNELLAIRDKKLFRQDGYSNMKDWVSEVHGMNPRTATRRMALAETYSLKDLKDYGHDRLELALEYTAITRADEPDWSPSTLVVEVPGEGGRIEKVPFRKASIAQLQAALDHQRGLADRRREDALGEEGRALLSRLTAGVTTDTGTLARIEARPSPTGLPEDTVLRLELRASDLRSVITRLQATLDAADRRGRGR